MFNNVFPRGTGNLGILVHVCNVVSLFICLFVGTYIHPDLTEISDPDDFDKQKPYMVTECECPGMWCDEQSPDEVAKTNKRCKIARRI